MSSSPYQAGAESVNPQTNVSADNFAFDHIRGIAIGMVVLLHVVAPYLFDFSRRSSWCLANVIDSLCRPGVPLFLMVSGALLLSTDKLKEPAQQFFAKRFRRLGIPCTFWIAFYLLWRFGEHEAMSLHGVAQALIQGTAYYHIPFLYYLVQNYLATPPLRIFFQTANQRDTKYLISLWIISVSLLPLFSKMLFPVASPLTTSGALIGYFVIGAFMVRYHLKTNEYRMILVLGIAGAALTIQGTLYLTSQKGALDEFFYEYCSLGVALLSISYFAIACRFGRILKCSAYRKCVSILSGDSFGIYLIHPFLLAKMRALTSAGVPAALNIFLLFTLTFFTSWLAVKILRKFPVLSRVVT